MYEAYLTYFEEGKVTFQYYVGTFTTKEEAYTHAYHIDKECDEIRFSEVDD